MDIGMLSWTNNQVICALSTCFYRWKFNKILCGLKMAPEYCQEVNNKYFGNIDVVNIYFDNICVVAETMEEHDQILEKVVCCARKLKKTPVLANLDSNDEVFIQIINEAK